MQITQRQFGEALVVTLSGGIDHGTAPAFEAALAPLLDAVGSGSLVLDFAGVDYVSSVGLRVLMIAAKRTREQQAQLLVAAARPVVAEIFAISRFNKVLTLVASLPEALAQCSAQAQAAFDFERGA